VAGHHPASGEQGPQVGRRVGLARVRAQGLEVVGEHGVRAQQRLDAHGRGDVGRREEPAEVGEGQHQHAEHAVGAVDQRQALLLGQLDRRDPVGGQRLGGVPESPGAVADLSLAHERQRHRRQRGQVAGASEGPVLVHDRREARVEHRGVGLRRLHPDAGASGGERREPEQHEGAHDLALHLRAGSGRVRADEAALELGPPIQGDLRGGQRAEPGGDAVVRPVVLGQLVDDGPAAGDLGQGLVGQPDAAATPRHPDDVLRGHWADPHDYLFGVHGPHRTPRPRRRLGLVTASCPGSQTLHAGSGAHRQVSTR
jgi:hypothetical protein